MSTHKVIRYQPTRVFRRGIYLLEAACGRVLRESEQSGRPCRECLRVDRARAVRRARGARA